MAAAGETRVTIGPGQPTQTAYTLEVGEPVVSNDLPGETRFSVRRRSSGATACAGA